MKKLYYYWFDDLALKAGYFLAENVPLNSQEIIGDGFQKPILLNGVVVEGITPEEIAEANKPIIPSIITARQLRLQLVLNGFNLNAIDLIIDSLAEPNKSIAKVSWEYATTFEREHQMLALIAQQLGITETELDTIFINAEKL